MDEFLIFISIFLFTFCILTIIDRQHNEQIELEHRLSCMVESGEWYGPSEDVTITGDAKAWVYDDGVCVIYGR